MPSLLFTSILAAGTTATTTAAKKSSSSSSYFLIILVLAAGVYFLFLRPRQQKARAARSGVGKTLSVGDEVVTIGGILGVVSDVDGDAVSVEVAPGTHMTFLRRAVNLRTPATGGAPANPVATTDDDAGYETYDDEDDGWEDEAAAGDTSGDHPALDHPSGSSAQGGAAPGGVDDDDGDGQGNDRGGRGEGRRR